MWIYPCIAYRANANYERVDIYSYIGENRQRQKDRERRETETVMETLYCMMTSLNGNIFGETGPLCGEFTDHRWIPSTKASDTVLWCFFFFIWDWINGWVNNCVAGDLSRHRAHYHVTVIDLAIPWNIPALAPEYLLFPLSFSDSLALLLATENKQVGIDRLSKGMYNIVFNLTLKINIDPSFGFIIELSNYLWFLNWFF